MRNIRRLWLLIFLSSLTTTQAWAQGFESLDQTTTWPPVIKDLVDGEEVFGTLTSNSVACGFCFGGYSDTYAVDVKQGQLVELRVSTNDFVPGFALYYESDPLPQGVGCDDYQGEIYYTRMLAPRDGRLKFTLTSLFARMTGRYRLNVVQKYKTFPVLMKNSLTAGTVTHRSDESLMLGPYYVANTYAISLKKGERLVLLLNNCTSRARSSSRSGLTIYLSILRSRSFYTDFYRTETWNPLYLEYIADRDELYFVEVSHKKILGSLDYVLIVQ